MKYAINTKVTVRSSIVLCNGEEIPIQKHDNTILDEFIGMTGIVESYNDNEMTGNTEKDPLHIIRFNNGKKEDFWYEELIN